MKNFYYCIKVLLIVAVVIFGIKTYCHYFCPDERVLTLEDVEDKIKMRAKQAENFVFDKNDCTLYVEDELTEKILEENQAYAEHKAKNDAIQSDIEKNIMTEEETKAFREEVKDMPEDELARKVKEENERYLEKIANGEVEGLDCEGNAINVPGTKEREEELARVRAGIGKATFLMYNDKQFESEEISVNTGNDNSPSHLVSLYVNSYKESLESKGYSVNSFPNIETKANGGNVYLTFSRTLNCDTLEEVNFIRNLAKAIGDNAADINAVYISVNGEAYESENWYYYVDENIYQRS